MSAHNITKYNKEYGINIQQQMTEQDSYTEHKKYDNRPYQHKTDHLTYTERKNDERTVTFMDHSSTPVKKGEESMGRVLRKLDEAEQKLVIAERKYMEQWRKNQKIMGQIIHLERELDMSQNIRLQELMDLQNKFKLLETQNIINQDGITLTNQTVQILKHKLSEKSSELINCQQSLKQITLRLNDMNARNRQEQYYKRHESLKISDIKREMQIQYEREREHLKKQVEKYQSLLIHKEKDNRALIDEMEKMSQNYNIQRIQFNKIAGNVEEQYKTWIERLGEEKRQLRKSYEQQIKSLNYSATHKSENGNKQQLLGLQTECCGMQKKIVNLQLQCQELKMEQQKGWRVRKQLLMTVTSLQNQICNFKSQYLSQSKETKKYTQLFKQEQRKVQSQKYISNSAQNQLNELMNKFEALQTQSSRMANKLSQVATELQQKIKQNECFKKKLNESSSSELKMNEQLTTGISTLQKQIKEQENEKQELMEQLCAQRLQNLRLAEQLEELKFELRRQYDLSIENTRKQLEEQFRSIQDDNSSLIADKEAIYLDMRELEKKYELLSSQIVTVNDIMGIATKTHRRYCQIGKP